MIEKIAGTFGNPLFETQPEISLNQCLVSFSLESIKQFISELLEPEINEQGIVQFKLHYSKLVSKQHTVMEEDKPFLKFG